MANKPATRALGNSVVALEPETGKEVWSYQRPSGLVSARGVAYWPGDRKNPPRIFFTSGHKLVALNAKTGQPDPGFGQGGEIPMDVPFAEVPTIYKNVIIVGANVYGPGETNLHPQDEVAAGSASSAVSLRRTPAAWLEILPRRYSRYHSRPAISAPSR